MTTQTKLSNPIEVTHEPIVKPHFSWPLALALVVLGLMMGVFVTTLPTTKTEASGQRAIEAEAARYTGLGLFYAAGNEANVQRASEAETARYTGLATLYTEENEISGQPGLEAEAARYNGLVDFYGAKDGVNSLAWPPRPTQFHITEKAVMPITENRANTDQDIGLMEFFIEVNKASTLLELHNK